MLRKTKAKIAFIIASFILYIHCAMYIRTHTPHAVLHFGSCIVRFKHLTIKFGNALTHTQNSLIKDERGITRKFRRIFNEGSLHTNYSKSIRCWIIWKWTDEKIKNKKKKCVWFLTTRQSLWACHINGNDNETKWICVSWTHRLKHHHSFVYYFTWLVCCCINNDPNENNKTMFFLIFSLDRWSLHQC